MLQYICVDTFRALVVKDNFIYFATFALFYFEELFLPFIIESRDCYENKAEHAANADCRAMLIFFVTVSRSFHLLMGTNKQTNRIDPEIVIEKIYSLMSLCFISYRGYLPSERRK